MSPVNHKTFEVRQKFFCESARYLPRLPAEHPCSKMHGHSFEITIVVRGPINQQFGWMIDFDEVTRAFTPIQKKLDHGVLNEVVGLENPTSENLAAYIYESLREPLPLLRQVIVSETKNTEVRFPAV